MKHNFDDITGKRFGIQTALKYVGRNQGQSMWKVLCDCGKIRTVQRSVLTRGTKSCGCVTFAKNAKRLTKHGLSYSPIYPVWLGMIKRCVDTELPCYDRYGGRGISVCDRWRSSVTAFVNDMGPRPKGFQVERIDNNGDYTPDNCKWASRMENARNRRNNHIIEINGERACAAEWSDRFGIKQGTIHHRVKSGWDPVRAVTEPVRKHTYH